MAIIVLAKKTEWQCRRGGELYVRGRLYGRQSVQPEESLCRLKVKKYHSCSARPSYRHDYGSDGAISHHQAGSGCSSAFVAWLAAAALAKGHLLRASAYRRRNQAATGGSYHGGLASATGEGMQRQAKRRRSCRGIISVAGKAHYVRRQAAASLLRQAWLKGSSTGLVAIICSTSRLFSYDQWRPSIQCNVLKVCGSLLCLSVCIAKALNHCMMAGKQWPRNEWQRTAKAISEAICVCVEKANCERACISAGWRNQCRERKKAAERYTTVLCAILKSYQGVPNDVSKGCNICCAGGQWLSRRILSEEEEEYLSILER